MDTTEPLISGNEETDPWAMNIIVQDTRDFTALDLMLATARAVVKVLDADLSDEERAAIDHWSAGRFRKVVRRAKGAAFEKAKAVPGWTIPEGPVTLHVCLPFPVAEMPRDIRRTQVSGLQILASDDTASAETVGGVLLASNDGLGMTAPKSAAAVAHVAQRLWQDMTETQRTAWRAAGYPVQVMEGFPSKLEALTADVVIRDAGLTEVDPGSITAVGWFSAKR